MGLLFASRGCWCKSGRSFRDCHRGRTDPAHVRGERPNGILLKSQTQIDGIRRSCHLTRDILDSLEGRILPGVTTAEIDLWVHDLTLRRGAYPAPLNYRGYPRSTCISLNQVICHGIPDSRRLEDGDLLNIDVTCILDGYYGDCSRMYLVGRSSPEAERLVRVTRECLDRGIAQVRPGGRLGDIGAAIQQHAEAHGYSVVEDFAGHGTGIAFHEDPTVLHFGAWGSGLGLRPNMVFTIEPMINSGRKETRVLEDGWTAVTADGSLSAQWEHTVLVTACGVEVLTA